MEFGEMDRKEPPVEVPRMPTTPIKPFAVKPGPIYTPGERNHLGHADEAVACVELNEISLGQEKTGGSNTAGDSGKFFEQAASDAVYSHSKLGFCEHLFAVEAESRNSNVAQGNNDKLKNPFIPSFILDNARNPPETYIACCDGRASQDTTFTLDNANKESRQIVSMQINMEEKDPGQEESNIPAIEFAAVSSPLKENHNPDKGSSHDTNFKTPQQKKRRRKHRPKVIKEDKPKRTRKPATPKPVQSKENPTVKRKYVRRKGLNQSPSAPTDVTGELTKEMPEDAKMSCKRSLNFDIGTRDASSSGIGNITALLGKDDVLIHETGVGLTFDLNTSMKQASNNYTSLPEDTQAPNTSHSRKGSGTKPEEKTAKRKYVRKIVNKVSTPPTEVTGEKMPESTHMSCTGSTNFDERARYQSYAVKENPMVHTANVIGAVVQEMNVGLAHDLNTHMKQAFNSCTSLPEDTQAPNTSSRRKGSGTKSEENPTARPKRKYTGKKGNKTSSTEVTGELTKDMIPEPTQMSCTGSLNFDERARDQCYTVQVNPIVHPGSEFGIVMQDMNLGFAFDQTTSMTQALNSYMSLPKDTQAPNTSPSRRKSSGIKPWLIPTGKRNPRKRVNKTSAAPPIEVPGETMPASAHTSCAGSINFDERARYQGYAVTEDSTVHSGSEIGVVMQETNLLNSCMKQALTGEVLPKVAQAPSTSSKINTLGTRTIENLTGKSKNAKKKGLNASVIPPTEMTELTEAMMLESNNMSWRRSLNFDTGTRDGRYVGRENLDLQIGNDMMLEETRVCLTYNQDTWMKEALNNCMPLPEETQHPSTSISKSTPLGAKLNAKSVHKKNRKGQATAQEEDISNSQSSKRKHSGIINCTNDSSLNLIGAHYNGLSSYQTNFSVQLPNMQKKRRNEKEKASDCYVTPVTTTKEVQQTYPQEEVLANPYASSSSCWIYGSGFMHPPLARSELAESFIDNTLTFDEFILSMKRLAERSPSSTCDHGSVTRIRNFNTEPNYPAKQVGISGSKAFGDAERPQTNIDALVAEIHAPPTKKKQTRKNKKSVHSGSEQFSKNEMLQHHNFMFRNYPLPTGKSSGITCDVQQTTLSSIDALTWQFGLLNINTEARDLAFHEQNALVPYIQEGNLIDGDGAIIPLPVKKHPRPKVDLDDETDRVWKLLMLDINSHGVDGTDEDKAKWWEEERKVFHGRADSFIARMHLVQGDRQFSRWKGSVVDSVVGVFLTQNVTDHLSSSAFMSLAARFPKKSSNMHKTHLEEDTSLVVNEPQVHIIEPEESTELDVKLLNQSVYDQSFLTIDIADHSGEKETINKEPLNSNDSCGTTSSVISLTDESNSRLSESSQRNIKELSSPMSGLIGATIEEEEKSCYIGDRKDLNDIVSSQGSVISSQISGDFSNDQNPEKIGSYSDSNSEVEDMSSTAKYYHFDSNTSFSKLLEMVSSTKFYEDNSQKNKSIENLGDAYDQPICMQHSNRIESLKKSYVTQGSSEASNILSHEYTLKLGPNSGVFEVNCCDPFKTEASSSEKKDENGMNRYCVQTIEPTEQVAITHAQSVVSQAHPQEQSNHLQQSIFHISGQTQDLMQKDKNAMRNEVNEISPAPIKLKQGKEEKGGFNWDSLRIEAQAKAGKREKTENTMDSLDWEAVRCANINEIAETIKERGMNNRLAERIKDFLNRMVEDHGSTDLEWLRDVPPDKAKEYLLSIKGLGLKSVECVRLLTLHHLAFPVDTNVGRIAVRLGWVPLQPLPESLQLHLLELYPVLESIQKYLWPRLCKLDQKTLYELHYQLITFGKVFCTKSKPNCNACPMRGECRHFASAFASARLALPGPEQKSIVCTAGNSVINQNPSEIISQLHLLPPQNTAQAKEIQLTEVSRQLESKSEINICQPIIEEPTTPEPACLQVSETDIEDAFYEDSCEIPSIKLNIEEFTLNLQNYLQEKMELQEGEMSKALVALNPEAASIPMPKLKNISRLRTEHCVYELPDTHPLLQGWDKRESDDPGKYLLAIWTPGETANSIQPPESKCSAQEQSGQLCDEKECFSCNSFREANSQIVRGTILVPCRTAMRGSFPLNGTYFQVNEVFADHDSSIDPINVPRSWIWNLNRRTVYFGTTVTSIFRGLTTQEIQQCFWRGYVCVRGFDKATRAPRPLMARLHFPASKLSNTPKEKTKNKAKTKQESSSAKPRRYRRKKQQPEQQPEMISNSSNTQQT